MKSKVVKSTQEQAVASWINYINQVRLDELMKALNNNAVNFDKAMHLIDNAVKVMNNDIIFKNRGGDLGMHGFIAEIAENGFNNAERIVNGLKENSIWVNNNGPADLIRDNVEIQQKFVQYNFSIDAILKHLEKYPDYIKNGGKYQIPKDHYNKVIEYYNTPSDIANKLKTTDGSFSIKKWNMIQDVFNNGKLKIDDIEPSINELAEVQKAKIADTVENEKQKLESMRKYNDKLAYEKSEPKLDESLQSAGIGAVLEGITTFSIEICNKCKSKKLSEFDKNDWNDILKKSGIGTLKGGVRGIGMYELSNFTTTPVFVANALITSIFSSAELYYSYKQNNITEYEFYESVQLLSLDASVSALSSIMGQVLIPIPILGALIGNATGTIMYYIGKEYFNKQYINIINKYKIEIDVYEKNIEDEYQEYIKTLSKDLNIYLSYLDNNFNSNLYDAFMNSVKLCKYFGLEDVLMSIEDIDSYFLD